MDGPIVTAREEQRGIDDDPFEAVEQHPLTVDMLPVTSGEVVPEGTV